MNLEYNVKFGDTNSKKPIAFGRHYVVVYYKRKKRNGEK